ncbi:MAG: metal-dependent hydrolase [Isosphaeraceae bacterium]
MSTPIGHVIVGLALARRFGLRSPLSLGTAVIAANLADSDILFGILLHGDPWKLHRHRTHTPAFALGAGAILGVVGFSSVRGGTVKRDVLANALAGAAIAGSHLVLDSVSRPQLGAKPYTPAPLRKQLAGMSLAGWLADVVGCAAIAWTIGHCAWSSNRR